MPRRLLALVGLLLVLATGCRLDVAVDTEVNEDGTGVVRVSVAADAELLARAPRALADVRLDDLRTAGWTVTGPAAEGDGRTWIRLEKPFASLEEAGAILASLNGPQGPLSGIALTSTTDGTDTRFHFDATARLEGGVQAFTDAGLVQAAGGVPLAADVQASGVPVEQSVGLTVSAALPGTVTAEGASVDDGTATWTPPLGPAQVTLMSAQGEWSSDSSDRWHLVAQVAVVALIAYLVALAAVGVYLFYRR